MLISYHYYPSYLAFYQATISKPLAAIDAFIKSGEPFTLQTVSQLLHISQQEVSYLCYAKQIQHWDTPAFLNIMVSGSSHVCQFYQREVHIGYLHCYSPRDVAYIYDLDQGLVQEIFEQLGVQTIRSSAMGQVLARIGPS